MRDEAVLAGNQDETATRTVSSNPMEIKGDAETGMEAEILTTHSASWCELFRSFFLLGWSAFGGPAAHVALFKKQFVVDPANPHNRRWLTDGVFIELLAMGQCLPGPTSTQLSFAIGVTQKGIPGGLLTGMLFQYPGLILMSIAGAGAASSLTKPEAWLKGAVGGATAAGIALVIAAADGLARKICERKDVMALCALSAIVTLYHPASFMFPLCIVVGGVCTLVTRRAEFGPNKVCSAPGSDDDTPEAVNNVRELGPGLLGGLALILVWIGLLAFALLMRARTAYQGSGRILHWFESFYRTGSFIYGGGQVVLPLLLDEVCTFEHDGADTIINEDKSWLTDEQFFAGLALAQSMPGPLFNLAAYLGACIAQSATPKVNPALGVFAAWTGLFGPGILLIFGVLPLWAKMRGAVVYKRMLPGLNASAVGLVVTAAIQMSLKVYSISPFPTISVCIGVLSYALLERAKTPAPLVIFIGFVAGFIGWATDAH